ncbi:MAG TPA: ABC transporter permease [Vicinamibacteria bacterium]|nr:ABC transporter permease [Vicinamibacteria bacterium]
MATATPERIVIEPVRGFRGLNAREIWESRDLILFLAWRDIGVRYKQTILGPAWAILQPLASLVVFTLIFGKVIGVPSQGVPYPVFCFAALLPWQLFSSAISGASNSMVGNAHLLSKVYFARLAIPIASLLPPLADFVVSFVALLALMAWYGIHPGWEALWLPAVVLLTLAISFGTGLWLAALNVEYRDIRHVVPLALQFLLFVAPIAYPATLISGRWRYVFGLNPMVGAIEAFRWALLGTPAPPPWEVAASAVLSLALVVGGLVFFRLREPQFADIV